MFEEDKYRKFGNKQDIDNRFFVSKDYKFIYGETPKVGISTIKKTLAEKIFKRDININDLHNREVYPLKTPNRMDLEKKDFETFYKFAFVRNPYTRILSAYLDKIKRYREEKDGILRFLGLTDKDTHITFHTFLETLEKMDPKLMNAHFRPQYLQLCYPEVNYNFIGRFERLTEDIDTVLSKIFNENTEVKTLKPHQTGASEKDKLLKFYSKREIQLVQNIFAQDFIYFDYSFDIN